jgi:sortase (surface protein transpeptidase)
LNDFEDFGIPKSNVHFVLYGHETLAGEMYSNSFTLTGCDMLKIFNKKQVLLYSNYNFFKNCSDKLM